MKVVKEFFKGAYYMLISFYDFPYVLIKAKQEEATKPYSFYLGMLLGGLLWFSFVDYIHNSYSIPRNIVISVSGITNLISFILHKRKLESLLQS